MTKNYEEIVVVNNNYEGNSWEERDEKLWRDVGTQLQLLLKQDYCAAVREDETGVIVIEYNHDENKEYWGCPRHVWISSDEDIEEDTEDEGF